LTDMWFLCRQQPSGKQRKQRLPQRVLLQGTSKGMPQQWFPQYPSSPRRTAPLPPGSGIWPESAKLRESQVEGPNAVWAFQIGASLGHHLAPSFMAGGSHIHALGREVSGGCVDYCSEQIRSPARIKYTPTIQPDCSNFKEWRRRWICRLATHQTADLKEVGGAA
jgi:hypothetical protein